MSNDLVKRMRDTGEGDIYLAPTSTKKMIDEAADRIEALEKALRLIVDNDRNLHRPLEELFAEFCNEARAALEGKDAKRSDA
jgi:hypothetical protein